MNIPIVKLEIRYEQDVVLARQRSRAIAELLGFDGGDQTRISTAVSEIARNAFLYGGGGEVRFLVEGRKGRQVFTVTVKDRGPGIADLDAVMQGRSGARTGMGLGITGTRRLMDRLDIESAPGSGTTVLLGKVIPDGLQPVTHETAAGIADRLLKMEPTDPYAEIHRQNQEILQAMDELHGRQENLERLNKELQQLNKELEETNLGVVALYKEIEEKNAALGDANERLRELGRLKSQFLANMSHELRTPLNSIIGFTGILLKGMTGDLNEEQKKQLGMAYESAKHLLGLINDILDLSKIEAGKVEIIPARFRDQRTCGDGGEDGLAVDRTKGTDIAGFRRPGCAGDDL